MTGTDLIAYLLARIDEEDAIAKRAAFNSGVHWTAVDEGDGWAYISSSGSMAYSVDIDVIRHAAHWDPNRILADIEAKREILAWIGDHEFDRSGSSWGILCVLAKPYSGRPDFDPSWGSDG